MVKSKSSLLDRLARRRALRWWQRAANEAATMDIEKLRTLRSKARQLRRHLELLTHVADGRLAMPMIGSDIIRKPLGADWAWRPELWRGPVFPPGIAAVEPRTMLGEEVTIFHDCAAPEMILRQIRNASADDISPFGLQMDVFGFDGSFLSLVINLPGEVIAGLKKKHVISMFSDIETERPLEIFARLNIKHGPNTEQIVREFPRDGIGDKFVEFDLAYSDLNEKRVEKAWIDFIFEGPQMNQVFLRDVTFARRPRAEI